MKFGALSPFPQNLGGGIPIAGQYLIEIQNMLGDAFSTDINTIVGAENIADARLFAAINLTSQRLVNNSIPNTASSDSINDWVYRYGISKEETDDETRKSLSAKYTAAIGPTYANISNTLYNLLGDVLISIEYHYGEDLTNAPTLTYWPNNPIMRGVTDIDMGGMGGTWMSGRCHIHINIDCKQIEYMTYKRKIEECLDTLLPATSTFAVNFGADYFKIEISKLDYNVLG